MDGAVDLLLDGTGDLLLDGARELLLDDAGGVSVPAEGAVLEAVRRLRLDEDGGAPTGDPGRCWAAIAGHRRGGGAAAADSVDFAGREEGRVAGAVLEGVAQELPLGERLPELFRDRPFLAARRAAEGARVG